MARFYGTMTNRLGNDVTAENPGHAHTRGWKAGVDVVPSPGTDGRDVFKIYMTGGSGKALALNRGLDQVRGEIVVALVDNTEATLKRLRRRGDSIALEAANPAYETRLYGADRVRVQGKLVGLIRRY